MRLVVDLDMIIYAQDHRKLIKRHQKTISWV